MTETENKLDIVFYHLGHLPMKVVPASPFRKWMDDFPDRHAYRCLPLSIANAHSWDILCPFSVKINWNGGPAVEDITLEALEDIHPYTVKHFAMSNFSHGIVTFHTDHIFSTSKGWSLMASGPFNQFKDNAHPLTGIIETDWLPYPFTMNWQMMRPGSIVFEKDEPFCTVMPIPKDYLQNVTPTLMSIKDNPELQEQHVMFRDNREEFMKRLRAKEAEAVKQAWQRHYFVGRLPDGTKADQHTNKVRLQDAVAVGSIIEQNK